MIIDGGKHSKHIGAWWTISERRSWRIKWKLKGRTRSSAGPHSSSASRDRYISSSWISSWVCRSGVQHHRRASQFRLCLTLTIITNPGCRAIVLPIKIRLGIMSHVWNLKRRLIKVRLRCGERTGWFNIPQLPEHLLGPINFAFVVCMMLEMFRERSCQLTVNTVSSFSANHIKSIHVITSQKNEWQVWTWDVFFSSFISFQSNTSSSVQRTLVQVALLWLSAWRSSPVCKNSTELHLVSDRNSLMDGDAEGAEMIQNTRCWGGGGGDGGAAFSVAVQSNKNSSSSSVFWSS